MNLPFDEWIVQQRWYAGRNRELTSAQPAVVVSLRDDLEEQHGDPVAIWHGWADDVRGHPIDCGHHVAEEAPDELAAVLADFAGAPQG